MSDTAQKNADETESKNLCKTNKSICDFDARKVQMFVNIDNKLRCFFEKGNSAILTRAIDLRFDSDAKTAGNGKTDRAENVSLHAIDTLSMNCVRVSKY